MGISLIIAGAAAKYVGGAEGSQKTALGAVVTAFVFLYTR